VRRSAATLLLPLTLAALLVSGSGASAQGPREPLTTYDGQAIWFSGGRSYLPGLHALGAVSTPWTYEALTLPQYGAGHLVFADRVGPPPTDWPYTWTRAIAQGALEQVTVEGEHYTVPETLRGMDISVLPLAKGMVWLALPPKGPENAAGPTLGMKSLNAAALAGATALYYTPYAPHGGSLLDHRTQIAVLPHRWLGFDGPVAASAWSAWLPQGRVRPAASVAAAAHELFYSASDRPTADRVVTDDLPGYPSLFLRAVPGLGPGQHALVAWVQTMARTAGGFVLEVQFFDTNYGLGASGLFLAAYYWSESANNWTPLTQVFGAQDIMSFIDVGSSAVYWQQALPAGSGDDQQLDLAQMRFDPLSLAISPVWAGDYIYGVSYADGRTWVHDMLHEGPDPNAPAVSVWTQNTP